MLKLRTKGARKAIANAGVAMLLLAAAGAGLAGEAEPAPHFESLKADLVYMREGPSTEHRVKWVYHRKGLPVEVLNAFDVWRRVRDMDGEIGWVHVALLSPERTIVVTGDSNAAVRARADADSDLVAEAEPGVVARIEACGPDACRVDFDGIEGWVARGRLWGVRADEEF